AWIVLSIIAGLGRWAGARLQDARFAQERRAEEQRRAAEDRERREADAHRAADAARAAALRPPPAPPLPPPTRQDLLAQAKARYEATLRLLASAGLDEAEF